MKQTNLSRGDKLLLSVLLAATLHFIDHILRVDHSGWPFKAELTPFTFIVPLIYAIIAATWLLRRRPVARLVGASLVLVATILPHVSVETPQQLYGMWAHNHSASALFYPGNPEVSNALGSESRLLGVIGVVIVLSLIVLATATVVEFARQLRGDSPA